MRTLCMAVLLMISSEIFSQDTTIIWENQKITLPEVIVRNN
ncbi:MAG: hypothetical protein JWN76_1885, partial [Chitinophagaceae bacterium]|nr:hypothetical protein [Chitinophagaceae bacterium]